jgi:hypothetical protein
VVEQIEKDCGKRLDAVVVTHRHQDHLKTFGLKGLGERLADLKPKVVVQPWTEHPKAEAQATSAPSVYGVRGLAQIRSLDAAQDFAEQLVANASRLLSAAPADLAEELVFVAEANIKNKAAVALLSHMGEEPAAAAYVHEGSESGLEEILPGVRVSVLGPPTLEDTTDIRSPADRHPTQYWELGATLAGAAATADPSLPAKSALFPGAPTLPAASAESHVRWVMDRLGRAELWNATRIVEAMNDALNNTSVILLFEVDGKALLFSGDAQWENWAWALKAPAITERLKATTLYKVGHHGSTNATPQKLWELFENRGDENTPNRLVTLLSTKEGKHHRVPRCSLVKALQADSTVRATYLWEDSDQISKTYTL